MLQSNQNLQDLKLMSTFPYPSFETSDGTSRQETGTLKQLSEDHQALEVTGSYKYVGTDGLTYAVTFVANEHGFQPQEHVEHQQ